MAHNINYNELTGKSSFFSVKQKAWHGLGTILDQNPTSAEAIKYAGLDFEVIKAPAKIRIEGSFVLDNGEITDGRDIILPDKFGTYRSDTLQAFNTVGKDYHIIQNRDAFSFFDAIIGGGDGILYETAGALGNGERIFITAKLPDYIRVGNGDDVTEKYIFLTTSHDGSGSITAAFTPVRIVCQNTLNAAFHNMENVVRIKHTAGAKERLDKAHKIMGIANTMSNNLQGVFNQWTNVKITDREVRKLIELALCPNDETLALIKKGAHDEISTAFKNCVDNAFMYAMVSDSQQLDTTKGTLFGAYNAVTGYYQNVKEFKSDEEKLKNIVLGGTAQKRSQKAFDLCTSYAIDGAGVLEFN